MNNRIPIVINIVIIAAAVSLHTAAGARDESGLSAAARRPILPEGSGEETHRFELKPIMDA